MKLSIAKNHKKIEFRATLLCRYYSSKIFVFLQDVYIIKVHYTLYLFIMTIGPKGLCFQGRKIIKNRLRQESYSWSEEYVSWLVGWSLVLNAWQCSVAYYYPNNPFWVGFFVKKIRMRVYYVYLLCLFVSYYPGRSLDRNCNMKDLRIINAALMDQGGRNFEVDEIWLRFLWGPVIVIKKNLGRHLAFWAYFF